MVSLLLLTGKKRFNQLEERAQPLFLLTLDLGHMLRGATVLVCHSWQCRFVGQESKDFIRKALALPVFGMSGLLAP